MATDAGRFGTRRQQVLLGVLAATLVVALAYTLAGVDTFNPADGAGVTSNTQRGRQGARPSGSAEDLDVKLEALREPHEAPGQIARNPFRFEAQREPEGPADDTPAMPSEPEPPMPAGPPTPPPIPLKFIGIIESPQAGRLAALSDGRRVFQGREGDIIEGRYRIVHIGTESIVLENADGSGVQQTIRLSGQ
jgi:hypothetical protein